MGQALARGHAQQVTLAVDRTGKQRTKNIDRALGTCSQAAAQPRQANLMATDQPINPGMQAAEGFAMRRQDQQLIAQCCAQLRKRCQPIRQWIGVGFGRKYAHI